MWYVLQTMTGREEELVHYIEEIVPKELYTDCFVAYYERVWRKQKESVVHVERLFPGYVFIVSDTPKELYLCLKKVPAMSKMIADGNFDFPDHSRHIFKGSGNHADMVACGITVVFLRLCGMVKLRHLQRGLDLSITDLLLDIFL